MSNGYMLPNDGVRSVNGAKPDVRGNVSITIPVPQNLLIQRGTVDMYNGWQSRRITFPQAYKSAPLVTLQQATQYKSTENCGIRDIGTTGFTAFAYGGSSSQPYTWQAIGFV